MGGFARTLTLAVATVIPWTSPVAATRSGLEVTSPPFRDHPFHRTANTFSLDNRPSAVVRVDNLASVRTNDLQFAKARAAAVFRTIGAHIIWTDEDTAARTGVTARFTLVLIEAGKTPSLAASLFIDALGLADPQVRRAHVFYDRVAALNMRASSSIPSILGNVMAHELGHLLLPPPGHSLDGIMRPQVNVRVQPIETFTKDQAMAILLRLREKN